MKNSERHDYYKKIRKEMIIIRNKKEKIIIKN